MTCRTKFRMKENERSLPFASLLLLKYIKERFDDSYLVQLVLIYQLIIEIICGLVLVSY